MVSGETVPGISSPPTTRIPRTIQHPSATVRILPDRAHLGSLSAGSTSTVKPADSPTCRSTKDSCKAPRPLHLGCSTVEGAAQEEATAFLHVRAGHSASVRVAVVLPHTAEAAVVQRRQVEVALEGVEEENAFLSRRTTLAMVGIQRYLFISTSVKVAICILIVL